VDIRTVVFRGSALRAAERPGEWFPQIAVAGRSNVGKSSLLNWIFRRSVARVAKAPGKTRTLNFYLVNDRFYVVDLPGYGYAKVNRQLREAWGRQVAGYLLAEQRLAGVLTLVDIRHGLTALDLELQDLVLGAGLERVVVLTKADKVKRGQRRSMQMKVQHRLGLPTPPPVVSVRTGEGRRELLTTLDELLSRWRATQLGDFNGTQEEDRSGSGTGGDSARSR
jgi:GTP-binding protein